MEPDGINQTQNLSNFILNYQKKHSTVPSRKCLSKGWIVLMFDLNATRVFWTGETHFKY